MWIMKVLGGARVTDRTGGQAVSAQHSPAIYLFRHSEWSFLIKMFVLRVNLNPRISRGYSLSMLKLFKYIQLLSSSTSLCVLITPELSRQFSGNQWFGASKPSLDHLFPLHCLRHPRYAESGDWRVRRRPGLWVCPVIGHAHMMRDIGYRDPVIMTKHVIPKIVETIDHCF